MKRLIIFWIMLFALIPTIATAASENFTTSGSWQAPAGVFSVQVELWGAGGSGGGGGSGNRNGGGGGAGGQYVIDTSVPVVPGNFYTYTVGTGGTASGKAVAGKVGGDTWFNATGTAIAKGGAGGQRYDDGAAGGVGSTSGGIGDTVYRGGTGGAGSASNSGGGGGGAGSTGNGGDGSGTTAGTGTTLRGGNGGTGSTANSGSGGAGNNYGGASGGNTKNGAGNAGANGYVGLTYSANGAPTIDDNIADQSDPVTVLGDITYAVNATDPDSDNYRITVCDASGITDGYPGVCSGGNELCNSTATASTNEATCDYTTGGADEGTVTAFGYACDEGSSSCTSASSTTTTVDPVYGALNVSIQLPLDGYNTSQNTTFTINVTIVCDGTLAARCGVVNANPRYNGSSANPDTVISSSGGTTPFFIETGAQTQSCGDMNLSDVCKLNWTINATGTRGQDYEIDVNFSSTTYTPNVADNNTEDKTVRIQGEPNVDVNIGDSPDPVTIPNDITYTATATDPEGEQYRLTVCSNNQITQGYPGTCDATTLCTSTATNSGAQASCTHASQDNEEGSLSAFGFVCDEGSQLCKPASSTTTDVEPVYGDLSVVLNFPIEGQNLSQYNTFKVNATITCNGAANARCGIVNGTARYNGSSASADTFISVSGGATPFFIPSGTNSQLCGDMNQSDTCILEWDVNATATPGERYEIDVLFHSNTYGADVTDNNTLDNTVIIQSAPTIDTSIGDTPDPITIPNQITYTTTASDLELDQYRLTVCTSGSINNGYPGTCVATVLCTSSATNSGAQSSCPYTTQDADEGTLTAYGFACDEGSQTCTAAGSTTTDVEPVYGSLNVSITEPPDISSYDQNTTFEINATITCNGAANARCGIVNGTARYNNSGSSPDTAISTSGGALPLYVQSGGNPQTCGDMNLSDVCVLVWTINASNDGGDYRLDVLFNSTSYYPDVIENDTLNRDINITVPDLQPPVVTPDKPNDNSGDDNGNIVFNFTVSDDSPISYCNFTVNNVWNQTNTSVDKAQTQSFTLSNMDADNYSWSVSCADSEDAIGSMSTRYVSVVLAGSFIGDTTDFSSVDVTSITDLFIRSIGTGNMTWKNSVDLSDGAILDGNIFIQSNRIGVDTGNIPALNVAARVVMENLNYDFMPTIYKDGVLCGAECTNHSYSGGRLEFNVSGFSNYTTKNNTALNISDMSDSVTVLRNTDHYFYANYTNLTSGVNITGAGVFCSFTENSTGSWSASVNMTHNTTNGNYYYNKTFSTAGTNQFNVTCNGSSLNYEILFLVDGFLVSPNPEDQLTVTQNLTLNDTVVTEGEPVNFSASANDQQGDNIRLTVCRTDSITNGFPGACDADQHVCNSTASASGSTSACSYTTNSTEVGNTTFYGYICEDGESVCIGVNETILTVISLAGIVCEFVENTTCPVSYTKMLGLENETNGSSNAHVQNNSIGEYNWSLCCYSDKPSISLTNTCGETFLRLSNETNAHVENNTLANYPVLACMGASVGDINCTYTYDSCNTGFGCLLSMASSEGDNMTNAHIGTCGTYGVQLCCQHTGAVNQPPTQVFLIYPVNETSITNRTPYFNWTLATDPEIDPITYRLQVALDSSFASVIIDTETSNTYYTPVNPMDFDTFYWRVYANDTQNWSLSDDTNFTITTLLNITLVREGIDFGELTQNDQNASDNDDPSPLLLRNDGNVEANLSINASSLFSAVGMGVSNYQYKADNRTETNSIDWTASTTTYTPMPDDAEQFIRYFNWTDTRDEVDVDIQITVPNDEGAGSKNSTIELTAVIS